MTVISKWGWEAGRKFFKDQEKTIKHEILRALDFCLIRKTIKSHSKNGLRIQRYEVYFRALNSIVKRQMPLGEGAVCLSKADLRGKFLWHPAVMPLPSPGQRTAREIKGAGSSPDKAVFHSMPTKGR